MDVTRARDGRIWNCRHMRHYMLGSSMNAISQDSVSLAAERTRKGDFERRACCCAKEDRPLTSDGFAQWRSARRNSGLLILRTSLLGWRAP